MLFAVACAEALPAELDGLADEVRVQFPWGSLLGLVLAADEVFVDRLAALLKPGGRVAICLSVGRRDGVDGMDRFDEAAACALLARLQSGGAFGRGRISLITPASARELHSTWANRLRVGHDREGWLVETFRPPARAGRAGG